MKRQEVALKVITYPTVTVVAHSQFQDHPTYDIPDDGESMERLGAFAAKGCYDSYGKDGRPCVDNQLSILEHKHGSVLEHSYVTLFVEGVTRALTLEMNRHRPFNISQRSTRYTKEEDSAIVLDPYYTMLYKEYEIEWDEKTTEIAVGKQPGGRRQFAEAGLVMEFLQTCNFAIEQYAEQVEVLMSLNPHQLDGFDLRKWARGKARNLLPHALETRATYTANVRAWRWFIEARSNEHAEPEIRRLAREVYHTLRPLAPAYFDDFRVTKSVLGIPVYTPTYSKV